ncbi:unnamed protein product [Lampetra fluviatilis]
MRETRDDAWRHNGSRVLPGVLRRWRRGEGRRHTESPACLQGSCIKWNRAVTMALRPKASSHTIHVDSGLGGRRESRGHTPVGIDASPPRGAVALSVACWMGAIRPGGGAGGARAKRRGPLWGWVGGRVTATGTRAVPRALFIINADCENNG